MWREGLHTSLPGKRMTGKCSVFVIVYGFGLVWFGLVGLCCVVLCWVGWLVGWFSETQHTIVGMFVTPAFNRDPALISTQRLFEKIR